MSLAQQVHNTQYVDTISRNVSLELATKEVIDRKLEMKVDVLEEVVTHIKGEIGTVLSCRLPVDLCKTPESKRDRL